MRGRCSGGVSGILSIMRRVKVPYMSLTTACPAHISGVCMPDSRVCAVRLHNLATSAALKALFRVLGFVLCHHL